MESLQKQYPLDYQFTPNDISYLLGRMLLASEDTDKKFQETDRKFQESEHRFKENERVLNEKFAETDKRMKEIQNELGGIGRSNGAIAEEFFFSALEKTMQVSKMKFDFIDFNLKRKRNNIEAQYDMILYNKHKVLIVEVKHKVISKNLREFYEGGLKKFKSLFPEYKSYKLYGAIAGMTFDNDVIEEAIEYGFYVITQQNQNFQLLTPFDFEPNEIK